MLAQVVKTNNKFLLLYLLEILIRLSLIWKIAMKVLYHLICRIKEDYPCAIVITSLLELYSPKEILLNYRSKLGHWKGYNKSYLDSTF